MIPAFIITLREVVEATLIVATILGVLYKLNRKQDTRTVWLATISATVFSFLIIFLASVFGFKIQEFYSGAKEELIEGVLMITSAVFITWAVFFLHNHFATNKVKFLDKVKNTTSKNESKGLFILVFTAIFREGFEIALFLTTIYFSTDPVNIFSGFFFGIIAGIAVSLLFFNATIKMPIYYAFRATSILLILFAAGLLARGVHEFAEIGVIPEIGEIMFSFLPAKGTYSFDVVKSIFGITNKMDYLQVFFYTAYISVMSWFVFFKQNKRKYLSEEKHD